MSQADQSFFLQNKQLPHAIVNGHHYSVAATKIGNVFADLFDDAHEFMSMDVAGFHRGDKAIVQMQIRPADSRLVILIIASCGFNNVGSATVKVSTLLVPIQQTAFMTAPFL
ncbi:hypothetical protein [Tunturiibacter gelidiferens]|uniref:hypothetical protein n=1 Tax=Tunturiibacter gelidiferens TaxID=3069689 RepID=UPI003D9BBE9F